MNRIIVVLILLLCPWTWAQDSVTIELVADTHFGAGAFPVPSQHDIDDWVDATIDLDPDYIFHLGDITEAGLNGQYADAAECFEDLVAEVTADRVWCIGGGNHDGLCRLGGPTWREGYYQTLGHMSQWYTLAIGNNVFIFVGAFAQPTAWASGNYGGDDITALLNQNKVNWLEAELDRWAGNNIFVLHHFPLHHTNIWTDSWADMEADRFIYESGLIRDVLAESSDVVCWFSGHVHVDSDARYSDPNCCDGNIWQDDIAYVSVGDIWFEHGTGYTNGRSTVANFRTLTLTEDSNEAILEAIDASNNCAARMTTCDPNDDPNGVWSYALQLPYDADGVCNMPVFSQAWDVWDYSNSAQPYQDDEGLVCDEQGWIESRFDFGSARTFATMDVDASDPNVLSHMIYYSSDGENWSSKGYFPAGLYLIPSSRYLKVITSYDPNEAVYLRDISFPEPRRMNRQALKSIVP